jgi:hypothetical protein
LHSGARGALDEPRGAAGLEVTRPEEPGARDLQLEVLEQIALADGSASSSETRTVYFSAGTSPSQR